MTNAVNIAQSGSNNQTFRNRIINGAMAIDQRNAGASVTPTNGQYTLDRWAAWGSQSSKYTIQQNAGSVTPPVGFINYMGATSSSAYSIVSNDYFMLQQNIEGLNVSDLNWGSANAQPITVSFWVRSSLTGTFGGSLRNSASARSYVFSYTINSSNTWEQKTITIAGDTTGTWLTTNGIGIQLVFAIGAGSTYSTTAGSWVGGNYVSATGATSVVGTNGATFYITGVQLEEGTAASPFENRLYGQELALCQRYFEKSYNTNVAIGTATLLGAYTAVASAGTTNYATCIPFRVPKRATPTMAGWTYTGTAGSWHYGVFGASEGTQTITFTDVAFSSVLPVMISIPSGQNAMYGHWTASAEL